MSLIDEFLQCVCKNKISVDCHGDTMLDEYYEVKLTRISPEHPIAVMLCKNKSIHKPGGALNTAYQFKYLNVNQRFFGFCDNRTINALMDNNCAVSIAEITPPKCFIPLKRRYLDNGIQVAPRFDAEFPLYGLTQEDIDSVYANIQKKVQLHSKPDIVVCSDYNKGYFSSSSFNVRELYPTSKIVVDPKSNNLEKWRHCTVIKPNYSEACILTGKSDWKEQAMYLKNELCCEGVVITRSGESVVGIDEEGYFELSPCKSNVQSVIGAGDCFTAYLSTALGHGFSVRDSACIAMKGACYYVSKKYNEPVCPVSLIGNKVVDYKYFSTALRSFKISLVDLTSTHDLNTRVLNFIDSLKEEDCDKICVLDASISEQVLQTISMFENVDWIILSDNIDAIKEVLVPESFIDGKNI